MPEFQIPLGAGTKVLGGKHTAGGEDAYKSVEDGFLGVDEVGSGGLQSLSPEDHRDVCSRRRKLRKAIKIS